MGSGTTVLTSVQVGQEGHVTLSDVIVEPLTDETPFVLTSVRCGTSNWQFFPW